MNTPHTNELELPLQLTVFTLTNVWKQKTLFLIGEIKTFISYWKNQIQVANIQLKSIFTDTHYISKLGPACIILFKF